MRMRRPALLAVLVGATLLLPQVSDAATYDVKVTLKLTGHLTAKASISGTGSFYPLQCANNRTVRIQRKKAGKWVKVAGGETGPSYSQQSGQFKVGIPDKPGRYRTIAVKKTLNSGTCAKSISKVVKHSH